MSGIYFEDIPNTGEYFECGCAASNVEWVKAPHALYHYDHEPRIVDGRRVCPIHGRPLTAGGESS